MVTSVSRRWKPLRFSENLPLSPCRPLPRDPQASPILRRDPPAHTAAPATRDSPALVAAKIAGHTPLPNDRDDDLGSWSKASNPQGHAAQLQLRRSPLFSIAQAPCRCARSSFTSFPSGGGSSC